MTGKYFALRIALALLIVAALVLPRPSMADDLEKGRAEVGQILDRIFNSHFRRSMRVRAALQECQLDELADALTFTEEERDRGAYEFTKEVTASESVDLKAYVKSIGAGEKNAKALEAIYSVAHLMYFSGVVYGAAGGLVLVDDTDKKKLCEYMVKEAKDFQKVRREV